VAGAVTDSAGYPPGRTSLAGAGRDLLSLAVIPLEIRKHLRIVLPCQLPNTNRKRSPRPLNVPTSLRATFEKHRRWHAMETRRWKFFCVICWGKRWRSRTASANWNRVSADVVRDFIFMSPLREAHQRCGVDGGRWWQSRHRQSEGQIQRAGSGSSHGQVETGEKEFSGTLSQCGGDSFNCIPPADLLKMAVAWAHSQTRKSARNLEWPPSKRHAWLSSIMNPVLNQRQRAAIIAGVAAIALMGIYPPWKEVVVYQGVRWEQMLEYRLLFEPPSKDLPASVKIDFARLSVQWIVVSVVTLAAAFLLKERHTPAPPSRPATAPPASKPSPPPPRSKPKSPYPFPDDV
jgi:hypothetical protein